jgi:competence protein ComEC
VRLLALGWLAGTLWLQCQPDLPAQASAVVALATGLLLLAGALFSRPSQDAAASSFLPDFASANKPAIAPATAPAPAPAMAGLLVLVLALAFVASGLLAGAGWSALRAQARMAHALPEALEGRDLQVTGIVASLPDDVGRGQRFRFEVERVLDGQTPLQLPLTLALGWYDGDGREDERWQTVQPGERWQWTVRLKRPHGLANPNGFDEEAWLLSEGVRATGYVRPGSATRLDAFVFSVRDLVGRARLKLRERILQSLPSARHAGVIVALVIGDQRGIAEQERQLFNLTGIGHLVSISGLHITMIAALVAAFMRLAWRHGSWRRQSLPLLMPAQRAGALAGLVAALAYVALAGFGVPAMRTLLMLAVVTAAQFAARLLPPSRVLATALLVVMIVDPWALLWPGFWLSFGAIACILFASAGRADADLQHARSTRLTALRSMFASAARTQWIVTVGLVPLSLGLFGQLSLLGPLANAFAIPVVSFIVAPLSLIGVALPQPMCSWVLAAAHATFDGLFQGLEALVAAASAIGQDSAAGIAPVAWQVPQPDAITLSIAAAGTVWLLAPRGWPWRWTGALCWLPLLVAAPVAPQRGFWLTAIDIGQGNAVLVETAHHRLLYDTGPAWPSGSDAGSRVILPYLRARGIDRLDGLVVSHADLDHAGGAASVLAGMPVGWFASSLHDAHPLLRGQTEHVRCVAGQRWQWDGVWFEVLHPLAVDSTEPKTNARSCTLRISDGHQVALLAADIEKPQELALLARAGDQLRANVLLAPHHGSGTSSTPAFLDAVAPDWVLFQVGYRNRYRHPKAEVVERYRARGIRMMRSDDAGAVRVESHPALQVRAWRCEQARYWRPSRCALPAAP